MKKLYGIFIAAVTFSTCHGMEKKVLCHLMQEKGVPTKSFNVLGEHNNEQQKYTFHEFTQEKKLRLEPSSEPLKKEFVIKEEKPVSQGVFGYLGYLWSYVPSLPSLPTWSTTQDNQDWKNPLVIKNADFPDIDSWTMHKKHISLAGREFFILFDATTGKKVVEYRDQNNEVNLRDIYNAQKTHAAVIADKKAHIYDIGNGRKLGVVTFEKSAHFMQTGSTDNHFVALNDDDLTVYDLTNYTPRMIKLPSAITAYHWMDKLTPNLLVIECKDGSVYFINPRDDYKLTEIVHENHFEIPLLISSGTPYFAARVDNELRLYDIVTGKQEYAGIIERGDILDQMMYISEDNHFFAATTTSCTRKGILLYNTKNPDPVFIDTSGDDRTILSPQFSSDGKYFSYTFLDNDQDKTTWRCHATQNGALLHEQDFKNERDWCGWAPQTQFFIFSGNKAIFVYDAERGRSESFEYEEHRSPHDSFSIALRKKGKEQEGIFFTFKGDTFTPKNFATDAPFTMVGSAFNADGTKFALATDEKFYVYDVTSGRYKRFDQQPGDKIQSFDFSTTDYFTTLGTQTVRIFNQNTFDVIHTLPFHREGIKDGWFNPEKTIFVVRTEKSLNFYYMHKGVLVKI